MHDIPAYKDADPINRERHGLKVGDEVPTFGQGTSTVTDIDDEGVEFSTGETACHLTVVSNMVDLGLIEEV